MNEKPGKKWFNQFDYMRAVAIVGIVIWHVAGNLDTFGQGNDDLALTNIFIINLVTFAIPFFFLISGITLFLNYNGKIDLKRFYKGRIIRIVPPYLLFSVGYIAAHSFLYSQLSPQEMLFMIGTFYAHPHFWFIFAILQFYLIFPLLMPFAQKQRSLRAEMLLIGAVLIFQVAMNLTSFPLNPTAVLTDEDPTIWALSRFLFFLQYIFWFYLGMMIAKHLGGFESWLARQRVSLLVGIPVVVLAVAVASVTYPIYRPYFIVIALPAVFLIEILASYRYSLFLANHNGLKRLRFLGKESLGIYLVHPIIIIGIALALDRFGLTKTDAITYPILLLATLAISIAFVVIVRRIPYNRILLG